MRGSSKKETVAIRKLVEKTGLPVVETFQAAGVISRKLEEHFFGRVGLFRNQPGDMLLKRSDLVIAIGYDPIEYEARNWNAEKDARVIVIDETPAEIDSYMQPLGVALPWAISAALVRPNTQIISVSGDGGFLFSAKDLETAVRKKLNIVHLIWNDGRYNMVEFQEIMKYKRASGVDFGPVDFVKYAEAFGAKGLRVTNVSELEHALEEGFKTEGPVIIDIPIDYRDNEKLGETILPDQFY